MAFPYLGADTEPCSAIRHMAGRSGNGFKRHILNISVGGVTIVMLIPARTDTSYFHDYIYGKAEIHFIRGRLKFEDENGAAMNPAPFPSMVVIYR